MKREQMLYALAGHREQHDPASGSANCACGEWAGPYTMTIDPRSYAAHLVDVLLKADEDQP